MNLSVFERLTRLLAQHDVSYNVLHHDPVFTSEEAARVRGTNLASGAKALICKGGDRTMMFVLPADRKLASKTIRRQFMFRSFRFATRDEVREITGLTPGAIPPFGSLFDLPTWCDVDLAQQPRIHFNAGDHAVSISMRYRDYLTVEGPELAEIAEPPT